MVGLGKWRGFVAGLDAVVSCAQSQRVDLWSLGAGAFESATLRMDLAAIDRVVVPTVQSRRRIHSPMGQRRIVGMVGGLGYWCGLMDLGHDIGKNFPRLDRWRFGFVSHRAGDSVGRAGGGLEEESVHMGWQMAHGIAGGPDVVGHGTRFVVVCIVAYRVSAGRS